MKPEEMSTPSPNQDAPTEPKSEKPQPPNASKDQYKKGTTKKGCLGCGGILAAVLVIAFVWGMLSDFFGPSVSVNGTTGTIKHSINSEFTASTAGYEIAQMVYQAATKHKELKEIVIECELNVASGVVDKYGKTVNGPLNMGEIRVADLDEVRKYADKEAYGLHNGDGFGLQIMGLQYSYLLKQ